MRNPIAGGFLGASLMVLALAGSATATWDFQPPSERERRVNFVDSGIELSATSCQHLHPFGPAFSCRFNDHYSPAGCQITCRPFH